MRRSYWLSIAVGLGLVVPAACGGRAAGQANVELTVLAAASLRDALTAAGDAYEADDRGLALTFAFDASSGLRTQIEQGAPADVFASADTDNPQALVEGGRAADPVTVFARNRLAIVVPADNPARIGEPRDLARPGVRIVAASEAVPISAYVRACLENLAALPGYPAAYAAGVAANVVSREDNVRGALAKVELGEADAAFVYATDAASSQAIRTVAIPPAANVEARYGAVALSTSRHPAEAASFVAWLAGPQGTAVLQTFGFLEPAVR